MAIIDQIWTFLGGVGVGGVLLYAIKYLAENPEVIDRFQSRIFRFLKGVNDRFDRDFVRTNVQAVINGYSVEDLGYDIGTNAKITWEKRSSKRRFLEENDVVLHLDDSESQSENIAKAVEQYVDKSILPDERRYLSDNLSDAITFSISLDMLGGQEGGRPRRVLYDEIVLPKMKNEEGELDIEKGLGKMFEMVENNRKGGTLGSVLLSEFSQLEGYGIPDENIKKESERLTAFLDRLATRDPAEDVPLSFDETFFDVNIGLVGRWSSDVDFYLEKCRKNIENHDSVYLLARQKENMRTAARVFEQMKNHPRVEEANNTIYRMPDDALYGKNNPAICCSFRTISAVE